jgi:hypothetical protein
MVGHAEDVLGELVGDDDPLAGGLGEVPRVDEELYGQDAQGRARGHLVRADLDLAVQAADVPGLERDLGRRRDPGLQRAVGRSGRGRARASHGAEEGDRPDQVIGQLGHVELGAHGGVVIVGFGDAAQDPLADGQRGLGGVDGIQAGPRGPLVGAGVTLGGGRDEPAQVVGPARGVAGLLFAGQPLVHQVDHGPARGRLEGDDHCRGARGKVGRILPAPAEHDAPTGLHLGERAGHGVPGDDGPPIVAARPQVDPRGDDLPAAQPVGLGDQGEGFVGAQRHEHRLLVSHQAPFPGCARRG